MWGFAKNGSRAMAGIALLASVGTISFALTRVWMPL